MSSHEVISGFCAIAPIVRRSPEGAAAWARSSGATSVAGRCRVRHVRGVVGLWSILELWCASDNASAAGSVRAGRVLVRGRGTWAQGAHSASGWPTAVTLRSTAGRVGAMEIVVVGAIAVAIVVGFDQLALWAERKGWIYWRRHTSGGGSADAGAGMLGVMDELFSPATRHTAEEIVGKQNGRMDLSVGGDGWIDLDSGRVHLPTVGERVQDHTFGGGPDGRPQ